MAVGCPKLHITQDDSGLWVWLGHVAPLFNPKSDLFAPVPRTLTRKWARLPYSWFGGIVEYGKCRTVAVEEAFGDEGMKMLVR